MAFMTGMAWCPGDSNALATGTADQRLTKWDVAHERVEQTVQLPEEAVPVQLDWCRHDNSTMAVRCQNGAVYLWNLPTNRIAQIDVGA